MENKKEVESNEIERLRLTAGGVVINEKGEVLLVRQKSGVWTFPKGGIETEKNESPLEAAKREIEEEAGIEEKELEYVKDFEAYERPDTDDDKSWQKIHMFLFNTKSPDPSPKPGFEDEIEQAVWIKREDVIKFLTAQKDKEFFTSILEGF